MTIEKQVSNLELSKRLKEFGVKQESLFWWVDTDAGYELCIRTNGKFTIIRDGYSWEQEISHSDVSAFTGAELVEMLPYGSTFRRGTKGYTSTCLQMTGTILPQQTEADARAKMIIYLLENNLLAPTNQEEV